MNIDVMTKRIVILSTAAIIGAGTLTSAFAAERNKPQTRAQLYAQEQTYGQAYNQASPRERLSSVRPANASPDKCVTDEGYGRFTSCDAN
jgi:hypothetical protein